MKTVQEGHVLGIHIVSAEIFIHLLLMLIYLPVYKGFEWLELNKTKFLAF
ncbi:MAG: hypothetical protein S4CHLAM6_08880 [Chlamydiae bacterium]|nr:hypothetical protein [Chlamydiota bacterium]